MKKSKLSCFPPRTQKEGVARTQTPEVHVGQHEERVFQRLAQRVVVGPQLVAQVLGPIEKGVELEPSDRESERVRREGKAGVIVMSNLKTDPTETYKTNVTLTDTMTHTK